MIKVSFLLIFYRFFQNLILKVICIIMSIIAFTFLHEFKFVRNFTSWLFSLILPGIHWRGSLTSDLRHFYVHHIFLITQLPTTIEKNK